MTPAERARLIDRQEFEAECRAVREKALRYAQARRQEEAARWAKIVATDTPKPKPKAGVVPIGRKPKLYTCNGETKSLTEWATEYNLDYGTLAARLRKGIPLDRALTMKRRARPQRLHTVNGVSKTLEEWAEHAGIKYNTLIARMRNGRTLTEALAVPKGTGRWRGVSSNFEASAGTGAGGTAQETPDLTFSKQVDNP